jgi:hypothetical protein
MAKKLYQVDRELLEEELTNYSAEDIARGTVLKPRHYKKKSFLFIIVSLVILGFSGWYVYQSIIGPVTYKQPEWLANQSTPEEEDAQTIADLKTKDTDQDGLTDYDEIYLYYTSIFLPDTDSDGYTDYEEVNSGNDPLCPSGQDCNLLKLITPNTKLAEAINEIRLEASLTVQEAALVDFRKVLVESGVPQEEMDKLTDQDLLDLFAVMESNFNTSGGEITPAEVRTFLLNQPGADAVSINNMSDQELLDIGNKLLGQISVGETNTNE